MHSHLSSPPWTLSRHVATAVCILVTLGVAGWVLTNRSSFDLTHDLQSLKRGHASLELLTKSSERPTTPENFTHSLPPASRSDDFVRDVDRYAQAHSVQVLSLTVQKQPATPRDLAHVRFAISAQSGYHAFKTWLADMQGRYPTMGVQTLSMRASHNDARQEIQLALILYVKS